MNRWVLWISLFASAYGSAQQRPIAPVDCDDKFAECKEDCAMRWGGTTNLKSRAKLGPCLRKCTHVELDCRETFFETRRNNLEEGAISGSSKTDTRPRSDRLDSDGAAPQAAERKPEEKKVAAPAPKPAYELKEHEVPQSSRSQISTVETKADPAPAPPPVAAPAPAPKPEEPKKEKKRALDEWDPEAL